MLFRSAYADPKAAISAGRLGRSFGCPALPTNVTKPIINTIKDGSVIFIYAKDSNYFANTTYAI